MKLCSQKITYVIYPLHTCTHLRTLISMKHVAWKYNGPASVKYTRSPSKCSCYRSPEQAPSSTLGGEQFSARTLQNLVHQRQRKFHQRNHTKSQALLLREQRPFKGNIVELYRSKLQDIIMELSHTHIIRLQRIH